MWSFANSISGEGPSYAALGRGTVKRPKSSGKFETYLEHVALLRMARDSFFRFVSGPSRPDTHPQAPKRRAWEALTQTQRRQTLAEAGWGWRQSFELVALGNFEAEIISH
jgi:hypothetical protein